jgi:hypothetical protein
MITIMIVFMIVFMIAIMIAIMIDMSRLLSKSSIDTLDTVILYERWCGHRIHRQPDENIP